MTVSWTDLILIFSVPKLRSRGEIHLNGHKISCIQVRAPYSTRKVIAADHYIIHVKCKQMIDVFVERHVTDYYQSSCEMIIKPSTQFIDLRLHPPPPPPPLMTATVVDTNRGATQVRVLNPFNEDISVCQTG